MKITIVFGVRAIPDSRIDRYRDRIRNLVLLLESLYAHSVLVRIEGYTEEYEQHLISEADAVIALCDYETPELGRSIEYALSKHPKSTSGIPVLAVREDAIRMPLYSEHRHVMFGFHTVGSYIEIPKLFQDHIRFVTEQMRQSLPQGGLRRTLTEAISQNLEPKMPPVNLPVIGPALERRRSTESPFVTEAFGQSVK